MLTGAQYYTLVSELGDLSPEGAFDPATREKIVRELSPSDRRAVELFYEWDEIARVDDVAEQKARFEQYYKSTDREGGFLGEWARFDRGLREEIAAGEWPTGAGSTGAGKVDWGRLNIVERERALDGIRWAKADELRGFDTFGLPTVMSYLVKLGMVERWSRLDAASGREAYNKLVNGL